MKVLFDPEIFFYGRCGMVRYYSRLIAALQSMGVTIELPLLVSGSDFISGSLDHGCCRKLWSERRIKRVLNRMSKAIYWRKIAKGDYDLLFISSPAFECTFLKHLPSHKPFMMVCHDTMRCVPGPEGMFDPSGDSADKLAYLARRASRAICISGNVKKDLLMLTDITGKRVPVIHTGNLLNTCEEKMPEVRLPSEYVLFMGARTGRKNFRFFIQSVAAFLRKSDYYLVCTGACTPWEADLLESLSIQGKVLFVDAPDPVLVHLYKKAACLVYPSLYEGYGLPVLEAMSLGCPVITTAFGGLNEVGGQAVRYIDPYSRESILNAVEDLLADGMERKRLVRIGLCQSEKFTVSRMAARFKDEMEYLIVKNK